MTSRSTSKSSFRSFFSTAVTLVLSIAALTGCGGMDPEGQQGGSLDAVTGQGALAPSNVQAFYAEGQWSTRFGVTGPYYGPAGHRGLDIAAGAGVGIPALRSGYVRRVQYSSIVGHTIAIESAPGDFSGYDHVIRTRVSVG